MNFGSQELPCLSHTLSERWDLRHVGEKNSSESNSGHVQKVSNPRDKPKERANGPCNVVVRGHCYQRDDRSKRSVGKELRRSGVQWLWRWL